MLLDFYIPLQKFIEIILTFQCCGKKNPYSSQKEQNFEAKNLLTQIPFKNKLAFSKRQLLW